MAGKGGARATSGPPKDPNALSRDRDKATWEVLPEAGREGDPPAWPLTRATEREETLWREEWQRPQAVMWERHHMEREVAMYVRALAVAEDRAARVAERTLVRQLMDDLGVSLVGMARHRWTIGTPAEPVRNDADTVDRLSAKARFTAIQGGKTATG